MILVGVWWLSGLITALYCLVDVKEPAQITWGDLIISMLLGIAGPVITLMVIFPALVENDIWNEPICKRKGRR